MRYRARWSDKDHNLGPFTYARDGNGYRPLALEIDSGDGDEHPGCRVRLSGFGHTVLASTPPVIRPWRRKVKAYWDAATIERLGRDWYWESFPRRFGVSYSEGFLQIFLGRQTMDSGTTRSWSKFLPWTQWRHVRHSFYDLSGQHFWTAPERIDYLGGGYDAVREAQDRCPSQTFAFTDFDGEQLTARTRIEEREWRFGEGWFKWLSIFRKAKIKRSLDICFSGETGKRKGSWKGGTVGHSIEMLPDEMHENAFRRYCAEHKMTFIGEHHAPEEMAHA